MPNPKVTVTMDVATAVRAPRAARSSSGGESRSSGRHRQGIVSADKLVQNIKAFGGAEIEAARRQGTYIERVAVSSTMGPGVKVEPARSSDLAQPRQGPGQGAELRGIGPAKPRNKGLARPA
jgi:large subunit ribosomal protein L1